MNPRSPWCAGRRQPRLPGGGSRPPPRYRSRSGRQALAVVEIFFREGRQPGELRRAPFRNGAKLAVTQLGIVSWPPASAHAIGDEFGAFRFEHLANPLDRCLGDASCTVLGFDTLDRRDRQVSAPGQLTLLDAKEGSGGPDLLRRDHDLKIS